MTLITSAAYVNPEFEVEFGRIPPAFLPVGNKKLIQHQVSAIRNVFSDEIIYITLPVSYELNTLESIVISGCGVFVVKCEDSLSLAASIRTALTSIEAEKERQIQGPIRILHGDTLVSDFPKNDAFIGVSKLEVDYNWEFDQVDKSGDSIWCGCFAFNSIGNLKNQLERQKLFVEAVRSYDKIIPLARVCVKTWMDFGHINTYFQSRSQLTTQRSFNTLSVSGGCVRKAGLPGHKIIAEGQWFKKLPVPFKCYSPQLIDSGKDSGGNPYYVTEYLPIPPLNEIYVHGRNSSVFWQKAIGLCVDYLQKCTEYPVPAKSASRISGELCLLARNKTVSRLELFEKNNRWFNGKKPININCNNIPSILDIVEDCVCKIKNSPALPGFLHGDFCFSNILYDSRSRMIKVIDPRGLDSSDKITSYGDVRYDVAKLTHSIIGLYDFIMADAFNCRMTKSVKCYNIVIDIFKDQRIEKIQNEFILNTQGGRISAKQALPLVVLLFFSMLPLHSDNPKRQLALLANGCRIYSQMIKKKI
jgi:hypothetical protein